MGRGEEEGWEGVGGCVCEREREREIERETERGRDRERERERVRERERESACMRVKSCLVLSAVHKTI